MQKIIIVEDDQFLREELENIYHKAGYEVCCVTDFPETGAVCEAEHPDLLVLDLGLPGISGFALCKEIRKKGSLPILVLTSRDKMQDELKALELGADEYLTKPCHKDRLLARTENLLKRAMGNAHLLDGDDFLFDTRTYTVCQGKDACHIPENQGKILKILLEYAGTEVKKECISKVLWGTTEYIDENALQVNVTRLKKTLKALGLENRIETIRGRGYRWKRYQTNLERDQRRKNMVCDPYVYRTGIAILSVAVGDGAVQSSGRTGSQLSCNHFFVCGNLERKERAEKERAVSYISGGSE